MARKRPTVAHMHIKNISDFVFDGFRVAEKTKAFRQTPFVFSACTHGALEKERTYTMMKKGKS